jgi:hypothetical protein
VFREDEDNRNSSFAVGRAIAGGADDSWKKSGVKPPHFPSKLVEF